jgi:hypothetical protein
MACPCCGTYWCHERPTCSLATIGPVSYGGLTSDWNSVDLQNLGTCTSGINTYRPYKYLFGWGLGSQARPRFSIVVSQTNPCEECTVFASLVFDIRLEGSRAQFREGWEYSATTKADGSINNPAWAKVFEYKEPTTDLPPECRGIMDAAFADMESAQPPQFTFTPAAPQRYCLTQEKYDVSVAISQRPLVLRTFTCTAKSGPYGSLAACNDACTNPLP